MDKKRRVPARELDNDEEDTQLYLQRKAELDPSENRLELAHGEARYEIAVERPIVEISAQACVCSKARLAVRHELRGEEHSQELA